MITSSGVVTDKGQIKNFLILGLSRKPKEWNKNVQQTDRYQSPDEDGTPIITGGYQLEPVPQYLAFTVGLDRVLMIETEDTRDIEDYFKARLHNMPNLHERLTIDEYRLAGPDTTTLAEIDEIINHIKEYVNENDAVTIYLDLHGGIRINAEIMNMIFSLLPMEHLNHKAPIHIDPDNIYSVVYSEKNSDSNKIIKAGEPYQLLDLVAGVHEFVEYGRTKSLTAYAEHHEELKPLVKAMDKISDALAMANNDAFEQGLQDLRKQMERQGDKHSAINTSDILFRLINQEYGNIIKPEANLLDKIRWCKDKKFYQLAITMCESQVPWYLAVKKEKQEKGEVFDFSDAIKSEFGQDPNTNGKMDDKDRFLKIFNLFVSRYWKPIEKDGKIFYQMKNKNNVPLYCLVGDKNTKAIVHRFLTLHKNIKATRNKANHLGSFENDRNNITIYRTANALDKAINEYLETVKCLRKAGITFKLERSNRTIS